MKNEGDAEVKERKKLTSEERKKIAIVVLLCVTALYTTL